MNWYYERAGQPVGPVKEEAIQGLIANGELGSQTRVWREDWPDWKTADQARLGPQTGATSGMLACVECGRVDPHAVEISGMTICSTCQPTAVAKLREGVPIGAGPWREGKSVVVCKDTQLPDRCFKCGEPSVKAIRKRLYWHNPLFYVLAISPLIYVVVALCVRKTMTVFMPLCATCSGRRWRNIWIAWAILLVAIALMVIGAIDSGKNSTVGMILMFSSVGVFFFMLFWILGTRFIFPKKIDRKYGWLSKAGKPFLDSLPPWQG